MRKARILVAFFAVFILAMTSIAGARPYADFTVSNAGKDLSLQLRFDYSPLTKALVSKTQNPSANVLPANQKYPNICRVGIQLYLTVAPWTVSESQPVRVECIPNGKISKANFGAQIGTFTTKGKKFKGVAYVILTNGKKYYVNSGVLQGRLGTRVLTKFDGSSWDFDFRTTTFRTISFRTNQIAPPESDPEYPFFSNTQPCEDPNAQPEVAPVEAPTPQQ